MRDNWKCCQCNKVIEYDHDLYRCCDANVCSPICCADRLMSIQKNDPYLVSPSSWNNLNNEKHDVNSLPMYNKPLKQNPSFKLNNNLFKSDESDESDEFNLSYESDVYYNYNPDNIISLTSPIIKCVKRFVLLFS